jgi:dolichol-phosphate mannosyltransferase
MLSIVAPMLNESLLVDEFLDRCRAVAEEIPCMVEIVIVDDGSTDGTLELLKSICDNWTSASEVELVVLSLSRNFGHQSAMLAGLAQARGAYAVTLDGDLQDPPETIATLFQLMLEKDADVVSARRVRRNGENRLKRFTASFFYRALSLMAEVKLPHDVGDFRIMNRRTLDLLIEFSEDGKYLRGLVPWLGGVQLYIAYDREERKRGHSKFTMSKMVSLAGDALASFSLRPLKLALWLSVVSFVLSILAGAWAVGAWLAGDSLTGWASLVGLVSFFSSITYAIFAILGLYIGRIHKNVMRRPQWVTREVFGSRPLDPKKL